VGRRTARAPASSRPRSGSVDLCGREDDRLQLMRKSLGRRDYCLSIGESNGPSFLGVTVPFSRTVARPVRWVSIQSLPILLLASLSCSTEPSRASLTGKWSSRTVGVVASPVGLGLWLNCGDTGWFPGPIELDSLNRFEATGTLRLSGGSRDAIILGQLYEDQLAVQWRSTIRPPIPNQAFFYLLPSDSGRPTDPDVVCVTR
jgi:hypothetical protein